MIRSSENYVYSQTDGPVKAILQKNGKRVILVDGPSCGGKTGFAWLLCNRLKEEQILAKVLSLTSFLKNENEYKEECKKRGVKPLLSSFHALDLEYLEECLDLIFEGETALLPRYDRKRGVRNELIPFTLRDGQVLIIEGGDVCSKRISPLILKDGVECVTVFADIGRTYNSNIGRFSANDLRVARRFVRDGSLFGYSADRIYADLEYERAVARRDGADVGQSFDFTVDTLAAYEPLVLKNELYKILGSVKSDGRYFSSSAKFLARLVTVPELDRSLLPEDSFYRTFL